MSIRLGLMPLLWACSNTPLTADLPEDMAVSLQHCEMLDGSARDWCAIQALDDTFNPRAGTDIIKVCSRMSDPDASDRCIELSVRNYVDPAPAENCDDINDTMMRNSCWLSDADRQMNGPIEGVMAVCEKSGPLLRHCVVHVSTHRQEYWIANGFEVMTSDIRYILGRVDGLEQSLDFGQGVGTAARMLGLVPGMPGPCDAFRYGQGKMACETALLGRTVGIPMGSPEGSSAAAGPQSGNTQMGNFGGQQGGPR